MKPLQFVSLIVLGLIGVPAAAVLKLPGCGELESWTTKYVRTDQQQIAPRIQVPSLFVSDTLAALFGQPMLEWTRDDFRAAHKQLSACAREARKRRDADGGRRLSEVAGQLSRQHGAVVQVGQARTNARTNVEALTTQPVSPDLLEALAQAQEALQGREIRTSMRQLPTELQYPLLAIARSVPYLPQEDVSALTERLSQRHAELAAAALEEEKRAAAELAAAQGELAKLPATAEGLAELDRYGQHPALEKAPREDAEVFLTAVQARRNEILAAQQAEREAAAARAVDEEIRKLEQIQVAKLKDLGELWDFAGAAGGRLRGQVHGDAARRFNQAFRDRFMEASGALLPAFKEALAQMPDTEQGLEQTGSAVADLTGIRQSNLMLRPYYQASRERGQAIVAELKRMACERTWKAAGLSAAEAKTRLWGAGEPTTLGAFICTLSDRGHQVHEYEDAGLFSDTHTLKLTVKPDGYVTLRLHPGEVGPDEEMLLGYELSDANQTNPLTVQEWEKYAARLTQDRKEDGGADCNRLAEKPRSELSMNESMALLGCLMSMVPAP